MPVRFADFDKKPLVRANRGRGFDAAIMKLAPAIARIQAEGVFGVQQIANRLNEVGLIAPTGRPFSLTATNRILKRLAELGLANGPLTPAGSRHKTEKHRAARHS